MSDSPSTPSSTMDYKSTLNLPDTAFAMKANLAVREAQWLNQWRQDGLYQKISAARTGAKKYILHDGPPYANGAIHLGHAVNKVLKDIILKSKRLSGFDAPYVPGWDCHGLPIELKVEEKVGKVGVKVDAATFRTKCREYAASQVTLQKQDFERLGVLADWDNPYLTMDFLQEANTVRALGKIYAAGHIQAGMKPVNWCLDCGSSLAEAEVEYEDKQSFAIDVGFDVIDVADFTQRINVNVPSPIATQLVIWTTTPWTLPANQAVALNPDIIYVWLSAVIDGRSQGFILAEDLVESALARYAAASHDVLATLSGNKLEGLLLQHPLIEARQVPVILGEHVTAQNGTGAVHTAPGHGLDDYHVGLRYQLKVDNPVSASGVYVDDAPVFAGMHIYKANPLIIDTLKQSQHLWAFETITHSYPHCWRHKTPIIFRATPQWFISMEQQGLRRASLEAITAVQWVPTWGQKRIEAMMEDRPDWCISRQRTWGVPIPFFIHTQSGELHPDTPALTEKIADLIEQHGVDIWFNLDKAELLGSNHKDYAPLKDTLDVWFDSGVTHFCVLAQRSELQVPADLYLEGSDQHRGWFQTSLLTGMAINRHAPFKQVLTHGFVVDEKGHKMSKSKGNVITPQQIIQTLGADGLRFWIASSDYRYEMAAGQEIFNRAVDNYRRIRNTLRFLLANLSGFDPRHDLLAMDDLIALDQYIVNQTRLLQSEIITAYDEMNFHAVTTALTSFCTKTLGGFYLDIIKDRQYTTKATSKARHSAQTALYHVVQALVRWMSPILSFTAQEAWPLIPHQQEPYVFTSLWYELPQTRAVPLISDDDWAHVLNVKSAINKHIEEARNQKIIGGNLSAQVTIWADDTYLPILQQFKQELRFILITSQVTLHALDSVASGIETELAGIRVHVESANGTKCERCWHVVDSVGSNPQHPTICARCAENVVGQGEERHYA